MAKIEEEAFDTPWTERMFIPEVEDSKAHYIVGVCGENEVICYGGFHALLDEAHITNIAVRVQDRGRGYGKFLLKELINEAEALGCFNITLEVKITNERAINLYTEFGFVPEGIRPKYYPDGIDALIMWRRPAEKNENTKK